MILIDDAIQQLLDLRKEHGNIHLVYGDCNAMHKVNWLEAIVVQDLNEHYLEEIAEEDNEDGLPVNAVVIG